MAGVIATNVLASLSMLLIYTFQVWSEGARRHEHPRLTWRWLRRLALASPTTHQQSYNFTLLLSTIQQALSWLIVCTLECIKLQTAEIVVTFLYSLYTHGVHSTSSQFKQYIFQIQSQFYNTLQTPLFTVKTDSFGKMFKPEYLGFDFTNCFLK